MSLASKITLAVSCAGTSFVVWLVHKDQENERIRVHQGVIKDQERQERKRQNQLEFEEQQRLTQYLIERQQKEEHEQQGNVGEQEKEQ